MRLVLFAIFLAAGIAKAVLNAPNDVPAAIITSDIARTETELTHSTSFTRTLQKRTEPDPDGWGIFDRAIRAPDRSLIRDTTPNALKEKYGHQVHHNGMPVFAVETAGIGSQAQLMQQAWADFDELQLYGIAREGQPHTFLVQSLIPTGGTYSFHRVDNQNDLLDKLDHTHQLERKFGPNLKPVLLGLPMTGRGGLSSGGHSAHRVWRALPEMLSSYDAATLRSKLSRDRFGLFLSRDGQSLLAITVGNNGLTRAEERVNALAPLFVAGSRRF